MRNVPSKWDAGLALAYEQEKSSKDPKTQVGAVLVDKYHAVVSTGFNGFAPGFPDIPEFWDTELKHHFVIHAEENALMRADWARTEGGTLYVSTLPCVRCLVRAEAKRVAIIVARLSEIDECREKEWYQREREAIGIFLRHSRIKQILL